MAEKKKTEAGTLKLCLRRSLIGSNRHQRAVVRGLGLTRRLSVVERQDTPEIRGMIRKVSHLVDVVADAGAGDETKERRR